MPEPTPSLSNPLGEAWQAFDGVRERFYAELRQWPVTPRPSGAEMQAFLAERFTFQTPRPAAGLVQEVSGLLRDGTVHVTHPAYFGLFNPSVRPIAVIADALTALYNPQLAAWSHAPPPTKSSGIPWPSSWPNWVWIPPRRAASSPPGERKPITRR